MKKRWLTGMTVFVFLLVAVIGAHAGDMELLRRKISGRKGH